MGKKYQSKILQAIHEDMKDMHEDGLISDERMRHYDEGCLTHEPQKTRKTASSQNNSDGIKPAVRLSAKGSGS